MTEHTLIPPHGGYRNLKSFKVAQLVCDPTLRFCDRYVDRRSRTHDQMVHPAHIGMRNIAEGSEGSATSKKMEIKLTQLCVIYSQKDPFLPDRLRFSGVVRN